MERRGLQDILDLQHASFALRKGCFFWSIMNYEAHRIEGVDNISSDNPLTSQDSRQEEKQMLHVRLPLKG